MTRQKITIVIAGVFFVIQLTAVQPHFSINAVSYGITALRTEFVLPLRAKPIQPAVLTQQAESSNDAILFTGDVLLARNIEHLMEQHDSSYPYQGITFTDFAANPYVVGNFESAIPETHQTTPTGQIRFSVHPSYLPAAREAGFTHFSLANNHSYDFGFTGYQNAGQALTESNVEPFGDPRGLTTGSITVLSLADANVAIIAIQALQNLPTEIEIRNAVTYASSISDFQVLYVHWGDEYADANNKTQEKLAKLFIKYGVDLIVGHHPHVVQNIERIDGVLVFYSLGNYIFDQYDSTETQEGLLLRLTLADEPMVDVIPVTSIGSLSQPHLMTSANHAAFLKKLAKLSDKSLAINITSGQIPLYSPVATSSKMAMINK